MGILMHNISWMAFNIALALIPVILGLLMFYIKWKPLRLLISIIWLSFLPNTLYLLTDLMHISNDWEKVGYIGKNRTIFTIRSSWDNWNSYFYACSLCF